jgi:hypothetical protein
MLHPYHGSSSITHGLLNNFDFCSHGYQNSVRRKPDYLWILAYMSQWPTFGNRDHGLVFAHVTPRSSVNRYEYLRSLLTPPPGYTLQATGPFATFDTFYVTCISTSWSHVSTYTCTGVHWCVLCMVLRASQPGPRNAHGTEIDRLKLPLRRCGLLYKLRQVHCRWH